MNGLRKGLPGLALGFAIAAGSFGATYYVAPDGNDQAGDGSAARPFLTLQKAAETAGRLPGDHTIVLRQGTYNGDISIPQGPERNRLVITAAEKPGGGFEDVIIEGAQSLSFTPVPGKPGVFRHVSSTPLEASNAPAVWEADTRIRYLPCADAKAVELYPASVAVVNDREIHIHTSDGLPPDRHEIAVARSSHGIFIQRDGVIIRGLQLRYFVRHPRCYAIKTGNGFSDIHVEDCRFWNCSRAIVFGYDSKNISAVRCRGDDLGGGLKSYGLNTVVEDCQFFRREDSFEIQNFSEEGTGIFIYAPGNGGIIRRNLVAGGFSFGIFLKSGVDTVVIENNTVIGPDPARRRSVCFGIGAASYRANSIVRRNVIANYRGSNTPLAWGNAAESGAEIDLNVFDSESEAHVNALATAGRRGNINTREVLFNDPASGDFRLKPGSPGYDIKAGFALADGRALNPMPPVKDSRLVAAKSVAMAPRWKPEPVEYIRREGPPRTWYVDPQRGRNEQGAGDEQRPFGSLQFALNRAVPGDRIVLKDGIYVGRAVLEHGGTRERPITIEAQNIGGAILDGAREADTCLVLSHAPYVNISGLEIRWFCNEAIRVENSRNVTIRYCRIWNMHPAQIGRTNANGIVLTNSPEAIVDHNLLYCLNRGLIFNDSPRFRLTHNTAAIMDHFCGNINGTSANGSAIKNNSFTFTANWHLAIQAGPESNLVCDYNNLAAGVRPNVHDRPSGAEEIRFEPGDILARSADAKGLMQLNGKSYGSLKSWQQGTGLDKHSIFAHPYYVDPAKGDFRLKPGSPNIGAAENGAVIGAFDERGWSR